MITATKCWWSDSLFAEAVWPLIRITNATVVYGVSARSFVAVCVESEESTWIRETVVIEGSHEVLVRSDLSLAVRAQLSQSRTVLVPQSALLLLSLGARPPQRTQGRTIAG